MPYITREDGEHFVIPSYRDVLVVKQKNQLKKEILLLSKSYGDYITLQKKTNTQYEVAFSPDTGYLLGESIWHQFKKPMDMIYCEAIPNSTEAILVIVKAGSVYLDGSFPLDSIPEELIIFLTQQNNFEIFIYGDVPISKDPEPNKFNFEATSVKSFTVIDKPVFPKLPLLKVYQLKLVDTVLKEQGIGELPLRQLLMLIAFIGVAWFIYSTFLSAPPPPPPEVPVDPYQTFLDRLSSPAPDEEMARLTEAVKVLLQITGWFISDVNYANGSISSTILSRGGTMADLYAWAEVHKATVNLQVTGVVISMPLPMINRASPRDIYPRQKVIAALIDRIAEVLPGNTMKLEPLESGGSLFSESRMSISVDAISPVVLDLIGKQFTGLPLVLNNVKLTVNENGTLTGLIIIDALGN